jgi:hypothetical protein
MFRRLMRLCLIGIAAAGCGAPSQAPNSATAAAAMTIVASFTETPSVPPTSTGVPPTSTPYIPEFNLIILGCNTGIDLAHGLGEVTNVYAVIQNVGSAEANQVQIVAGANDEGREHPDKTKLVSKLPPGYEITLKFTVDSTFRQDTSVTLDLSSAEGVYTSVQRDDCRDLRTDLPDIETRLTQGVTVISKGDE